MSVLPWRGLAALIDPLVPLAFGAPGFHARRQTWPDPDLEVDLGGRTVVVTGANSGLGLALSTTLAARGAEVRMACRSARRGAEAVLSVRDAVPGARVHLDLVDLSDLDSVRRLGTSLVGRPLHAVVHNAGALVSERRTGPEGLEVTFATHVVGPHVLTRALLPALADGGGGRVIWVSSGGMYTQPLYVDRLRDPPCPFDGTVAYARAKRAQVVLAQEWSRRVSPPRPRFEAMHPGWADTPGVRGSLPAFRRATRCILRTPEQGADTAAWLVACPDLPDGDGGFWLDRVRRRTVWWPGTRPTEQERNRLWELCEQFAATTL